MSFEQRICSFTGRPIPHTDNASVQLTFVELDSDGRATDKVVIYNACGKIRKDGTIDEILTNALAQN